MLSRSAVLPIALLLGGFLVQSCATEQAKLNDATFGVSTAQRSRAQVGSDNTAIGRDAVSALPDPLNSGIEYVAQAGQPLPHESGELLSRYRYAEASDNDGRQGHSLSSIAAEERAAELPYTLLPATKLFSIDAVDAALKAILFSLASDAGLELHVRGKIDKVVTASVADKTIDQILPVLAEQANFDWDLHDNILTIRSGAAYGHTYPVNYLNIHRRTQSTVGLATQVGTINASDASGNSIANSSETRIENSSEHHFWLALESGVQSILARSQEAGSEPTLAINREAGLVTIFAGPDVHRALKRYLTMLHASTQRQVLIEATVVEVALSSHYETGVDWQVIAKGVSGVNAAQVLVGAASVALDTVDRIAAPAGLVSLVQQGRQGDVKATLSLLEQFGDVRILSRPRIIAMNNQSSVLKVVDNRVYFTVHVQRRQTEDKDEIITETEIHTVPVGLVMNVTPQISQNGSVMLNVRPTLSRILGFVNDPNPELALANVRNGVPEIQVREMESMLQVHSGDVAIIGGLMQETQSENDAQLPGLGRIPLLGKLFSKKSRERRQTELLIVLRPTVLENSASTAG